MNKFFIIFLLTVSASSKNQVDHLKYGTPSTNGTILYREGYVLLHDNSKKVPLWVSYHLTKEHLQGTQERVDKFQADPDLQIGKRAELSDYKGSAYDMVQMAPAADMKRSYKVMVESFYLSNICPQLPQHSKGLWRSIEKSVRAMTNKMGEVWVICGPIFKDLDGDGIGDYLERIGSNKVWVPTHFYKISVFHDVDDVNHEIFTISFIIPNKTFTDNFVACLTTIDSIEVLTGLDFLNKLPDNIEDEIETRKELPL